jgi:RNA polymerase sigma-70 factor, ECF subfamily
MQGIRGVKVSQSSGVNSIEGMQNTDFLSLVSQCITGNEEAIEFLFRQYELGVFRLALSIVDDPMEASEITQETFISAINALGKYRDRQSFKAWLYTITVNSSRGHLRKRRAREKLQATLTRIFRIEFGKQVLPEESFIQNEREAALWNSLNRLDDNLRVVVVLRYFHELPIREISEILAIPEGTIHSRLHTAREQLRTVLEQLNRE